VRAATRRGTRCRVPHRRKERARIPSHGPRTFYAVPPA
jgi:hypothetical protein